MFVLLGALVWGLWSQRRYVEGSGNIVTQAVLWFAGVLSCILACMCKPAAMCFPFVLMSVEGVYFSNRINRSFSGRKMVLSVFLRYLPMLAIAVATGALAVYSQTHADGYLVRDLFSASLPWRLLNALVSTGRYLFMSIIPVGIHLDYRAIPEGVPLGAFTGLTTLLLVSFLSVLFWVKSPPLRIVLLSSALWFFSSLVPTLGIFGSFGEHAMADRFYYLPSLAFVFMSSVLFAKFYNISSLECGKKFWKSPAVYVTGSILLFFAGTSFTVARAYRNDLAVFTRTLECDPEHGRALAHVGEGECAEGKLDSGIDKLRKSVKIRPQFDTSAKLSYALMRRGKSADYKEIRVLLADLLKNRKLDQKGQALEALGTAALVERKWQEEL
jgi:tetratricopeptide (TPR) repeat protein